MKSFSYVNLEFSFIRISHRLSDNKIILIAFTVLWVILQTYLIRFKCSLYSYNKINKFYVQVFHPFSLFINEGEIFYFSNLFVMSDSLKLLKYRILTLTSKFNLSMLLTKKKVINKNYEEIWKTRIGNSFFGTFDCLNFQIFQTSFHWQKHEVYMERLKFVKL